VSKIYFTNFVGILLAYMYLLEVCFNSCVLSTTCLLYTSFDQCG